MNASHTQAFRGQRGFTLVEILVGVAISLVGLLVMFKTTAIWDSHTRSTTAGGDAQTTGTLAIFNLERDIKQAGMGFSTAGVPAMGCDVQGVDTSSGTRNFNFNLRPVEIVVGASGAPDRINVLYGSSSYFVSQQTFTEATASTKKTARRNGFKAGDLVVAADATNCGLLQVTSTDNADLLTLDHINGNFASFYAPTVPASAVSRFNPSGGLGFTFSTTPPGQLFNLGPEPRRNTWQIEDGRVLTRTDLIFNTGRFDIAEGVVNIKAQYGIDTDADDRITSAAPNEWGTAAPTNWSNVRAIRVAVLVRSKQFEKSADQSASAAATAVTPTANTPTWAGGTFAMRNADGTTDSYGDNDANPNNWRYYRYRVYEKEIPLRNMIWGTAP
ncbi:MAG: PilW family protein [Burkholderiaceae bacterium]